MPIYRSWNSAELIKRYAKDFGVNIAEFVRAPEITLQRDNQTGIWMFDGCEPGSGQFYEVLANKPYYYIEDKWEFDQAIDCFPDSRETSVLEIGCGSGAFLERCRAAGYNRSRGIEFNDRALGICKEKGLAVCDSRLEEIADSDERFDVVCAYQVLEHVPNPTEFVRLAKGLLKDDGKLILSTPNAASFLGRFEWNLLDLPPHHMSRWDAQSYEQTSELLGLSINEMRHEPLAAYHYRFFASSLVQWLPERSIRKKILKPLLRAGFKAYPFKKRISGHTLMTVMSQA